MDFLLSGAGRKSVATATDYRALTKFRMNTLFHSIHLTFPLFRDDIQAISAKAWLTASRVGEKASHAWKQTAARPLLRYSITEIFSMQEIFC